MDPASAAAVPVPDALLRVAEAAKGFLPAAEALALYDAAYAVAGTDRVLLEVGTYCGKSATFLGAAAQARGGLVVTVDHHRGSEENQPGWEWHDPELVDARVDRIDTLPFFRQTMHLARLEDVVVAVVARSPVAASLWNRELALLFIDGGHTEEHANADYDSWARFLGPGGVLAIHDVFPDPADGGQAPYHVYRRALDDGFQEIRCVGSLRVLRRPHRV
jgi:predicted O-methyltransferase YrrM